MIELILEDYLASLKEKDELDVLLSDLLKLDGYTVKSLPKKDNMVSIYSQKKVRKSIYTL